MLVWSCLSGLRRRPCPVIARSVSTSSVCAPCRPGMARDSRNGLHLSLADEGPLALLWDSTKDELVKDRFGVAYFIMMLMGVGSLLPWNALITPVEYWQLRISACSFASSFESMFSCTFTFVSFLSLLSLQRLQHHMSVRLT